MLHYFSHTKRKPSANNRKRSAADITYVHSGKSDGRSVLQTFPTIEGKIDKYQFARNGLSTTDALISFLQPICEPIDNRDNIAWIFFTDFSKGFDRIDHNILIANLQKLNIHPALTNWVSAFLSNRMQAVRLAGVLSNWRCPNGGILQGTKLGVILFSVWQYRRQNKRYIA
jgi:hypothetical protein